MRAAKTEGLPVTCEVTPHHLFLTEDAIGDDYNTFLKVNPPLRTAEDAALYYTIVEEILGPEWLNTDMFRIGASSAANNLLSAIEGREIKYY